MNKNLEYINDFDKISEDLKYISNSKLRLKILKNLYENPKNMRSINEKTGISYSAISLNMHSLELHGFVYRENNRYFITNSAKIQLSYFLKFSKISFLLEEIASIINKHIISGFPDDSIDELHMLDEVKLIESNETDVYKAYSFIESTLLKAKRVKCILPFFYKPFTDILQELISNNLSVQVFVFEKLLSTFVRRSKIQNISTFSGNNNFLLIITDESMVIGLFKDDGNFDQNRLLVSQNEKSIKWANNIFDDFKIRNK